MRVLGGLIGSVAAQRTRLSSNKIIYEAIHTLIELIGTQQYLLLGSFMPTQNEISLYLYNESFFNPATTLYHPKAETIVSLQYRQIMSKKKNLNLSKSSLFRIKSYKKTVPSFEQFAKSSLGAFLEKISEQKQQVLKNIGQTWHMVSAMGMEGIKQSILKYLKKLMDEKAYQHREIIMELLRNGSYPKEEKPNKDFNFKTLKAEIENLKEQLESYLLRRFSRDIQIIQQRIHHSDDLIKDLIDLSTYQKLICSFRPALISNPTDIPRELQDISRATATAFTYFNHIQQLRYDKLANVEKDICQSHALRCREKLYSRQVLDF